jgi:hypothetical protein
VDAQGGMWFRQPILIWIKSPCLVICFHAQLGESGGIGIEAIGAAGVWVAHISRHSADTALTVHPLSCVRYPTLPQGEIATTDRRSYAYFKEEPGREIGGKAAHQRRGAKDRGRRGEAAGALAEGFAPGKRRWPRVFSLFVD